VTSQAHEVRTADELAAALALRFEVFVVEQGVPVDLERDEHDRPGAGTVHVVGRDAAGAVVATGRLVVEHAGFAGLDPALGPVAHVGRIAVAASARGQGWGTAVVRALEAAAVRQQVRVAYLGAQTHAVGMYARLGYAVVGEEFDDAGLPHRHMWRTLSE